MSLHRLAARQLDCLGGERHIDGLKLRLTTDRDAHDAAFHLEAPKVRFAGGSFAPLHMDFAAREWMSRVKVVENRSRCSAETQRAGSPSFLVLRLNPSPKAFDERVGVAVIASGRRPVAPGGRIPGRFGPFDRATGHRRTSFTPDCAASATNIILHRCHNSDTLWFPWSCAEVDHGLVREEEPELDPPPPL